MSKTYRELTVHGQARRLRALALEALQHYDLEAVRVRLVTNDFNGIFRVDTAAGRKYILRVALPEGGHHLANLRAEMAWLAALRRDTDLSVPCPLAARNGELVVQAESKGVPEPRWCTISSWVPGTDLSRRQTPANLRALGRLSAQLHAQAAAFKPPRDFAILRFDTVYPFPEPFVLFAARYRPLLPPRRRAVYEQAVAWAQTAIDRLKASGEPMRVIHGDLHPANVRVCRRVLSPIDFEDLMWGWPVQDIATTLYYFQDEANYREARAAFQAGYTSYSPWPERYPGEIDAFIAARGFGLANFILSDPNPNWRLEARAFLKRVEARLRRLLKERSVRPK
jgi:Ser/Thr protein kinase RdoA (MazF antagonist)